MLSKFINIKLDSNLLTKQVFVGNCVYVSNNSENYKMLRFKVTEKKGTEKSAIHQLYSVRKGNKTRNLRDPLTKENANKLSVNVILIGNTRK